MTIFRRKGEGVWAESKKSLSEKTEVVKKGGEGGLSFFLLKVKKTVLFIPPFSVSNIKMLHKPLGVQERSAKVGRLGGERAGFFCLCLGRAN